MDAVACPVCAKPFVSNVAKDFRCCGRRIRVRPSNVEAPEDTRRRKRHQHLHQARTICQTCEYFIKKTCSGGCSLYELTGDPKITRPCDMDKWFLAGGGCVHPIDPSFDPIAALKWRHRQQPSLADLCIAVTSLSSHPHHLDRQSECLRTWHSLGLAIASVNRTSEIPTLRDRYPLVQHWIRCDDTQSIYSRPTQRIKRLAMVACDLDTTAFVLNSDIALIGDQQTIVEPVRQDKFVGLIRWDHDQGFANPQRQAWGIDGFSFTPSRARSLPDLGLSIGRPFWDYAIPYHARQNEWPMHFVGTQFAWHQRHDVLWDMKDWCVGAENFCHHYGEDFEYMRSQFRQELPFPPSGVTSTES